MPNDLGYYIVKKSRMDDREMTLRIRNGQSTLEYVIILAVVVGAIIGIAVIAKPSFVATYNMIYGNAVVSNVSGGGA